MKRFRWLVRGFTLIEMLVVIGIIGLILASSIPAFTSYSQQMGLKTSTRDIASLLQLARQQALSSRSERTIVYDPATRQVAIAESLDADEPRRVTLPKSVELELQGGQADAGGEDDNPAVRFAFQPSGALGGRSVSIVLTGKGKSRTITVTGATGSINVH